MLNKKPHTHGCPYCEKDVECAAAGRGGCLFASTSMMTCIPCSNVVVDAIESGTFDPETFVVGPERHHSTAA